jgi:poly-gamma-glutamate synthesis protein (capsule biosynthesis protein)
VRPRSLVVVAAATAAVVPPPEADAANRPIRVVSELPRWVAPGGLVVVRGWAEPRERVALRTAERVVARTTAGPKGRYVLRARLLRRGKRTLSVVAGGVTARIGTLFVRPLRLSAVGDVTFGEGVGTMIRARGPRYPWLEVAPVLRRADLAIANLETVVSTRGTPVPGKEFTFRGPPRALRAAVRYAGLDVFTVANNHSLDYGRTAFLDTLRYAVKFGAVTTGGGRNLERATRARVLTAGGIRLAFLGFSDVRPPGFDAGPSTPGTAPAFPALVAGAVRAARRRSDVVVTYFHWGVERVTVPNERQRSLARVALRNGATVVLGAHPHVLQPRERRGRRFVAWSLGNFVFTGTSDLTRRTGILTVRLGRGGVLGSRLRPARIVLSQPRLG